MQLLPRWLGYRGFESPAAVRNHHPIMVLNHLTSIVIQLAPSLPLHLVFDSRPSLSYLSMAKPVDPRPSGVVPCLAGRSSLRARTQENYLIVHKEQMLRPTDR
jgi:hypothetical protein